MSVGALRGEVAMIADGAEFHARNWVLDNEPDADQLAAEIAEMMAVYCQTASLLAADWYNSREKESRFFAYPVFVVPPERAQDTARWVFRGADNPTIENIEKRIASAAHSMVFDAARDTVSSNAALEGVAYVRQEEQGACDDCKKLQTATPRTRSSAVDDVKWERHQRCEFLFEPVRTGLWTPPAFTESASVVALDSRAH